MSRKYELIIRATNLNSNSEFESWRGIQQYLNANRRLQSNSDERLSDGQFREVFRAGLPDQFISQVRNRLRRSLEESYRWLDRIGPYGFEFIEELRRVLKRSRRDSDGESLDSADITAILRAVYGENALRESEAELELRAAIAASASVSLRVEVLRLGSVEAEILLCGYEELQKHLKLDLIGFDAFVEMCLIASINDLYSLNDGAVSVQVKALSNPEPVRPAGESSNNVASTNSKPALDEFFGTWAKKMFAAAIFPIVLAAVVGGAIIYQFDKVDASRQKLAEQQVQLLKQEGELRKLQSDQTIKNQAELANEYRALLELWKKQAK